MRVRVAGRAAKTAMLCGFVLEGSDEVLGLDKSVARNAGALAQSISDMGGKFGAISVVPLPGESPQRILLAGLGKEERLTGDSVRFVSGRIARKAREIRLKEFAVIAPPDRPGSVPAVSQIVEGCMMSLYKFDRFKSEEEGSEPDLAILASDQKKASEEARTAEIISNGALFARGLANLPPNECAPATLAESARKLAKRNGLKCRVISKQALKRGGFGGITAVGQGSRNEPRLIILEYGGGPRGQKPVVLVGKAVTFDTGGISLKPGEKMDEMKFDKCGGCTVLGIVKAASELGLRRNIVGIVPSVENMPGGGSYRPGDIIRLYSGKTAEILNTDAEGRLILADALSYAERRYSPSAIIDLATLTGACIVALGNNVAGMVSSSDALAEELARSSKKTTEEIWRLPLGDDYMDMIKSEVADMRNMGIGRAAGTIAAAAFLKNAVEKTPWLHLDIAGVAWTQPATKEKPYNPGGATAFGVRLVTDYLQEETS